MVLFQKAEVKDGQLVITESREVGQESIMKCPFYILVADHYRDDGSCKCNDAAERKRMRKWGYTAKDFKGIPLK